MNQKGFGSILFIVALAFTFFMFVYIFYGMYDVYASTTNTNTELFTGDLYIAKVKPVEVVASTYENESAVIQIIDNLSLDKLPTISINFMADVSDWLEYNDQFAGLEIVFKYPKRYLYKNESSAKPLLLYSDSFNYIYSEDSPAIEITRTFGRNSYDGGSPVKWYLENKNLAPTEYIPVVKKIELPQKEVYRAQVKRAGNSDYRQDIYFGVSNGYVYEFKMVHPVSLNEFYTIIQTFDVVACRFDCY